MVKDDSDLYQVEVEVEIKYNVLLSLCKQTSDVLLRKFSLAHARSTHLSQVIKSHNKIINIVVNVLKTSMFTENNQHIQILINMRCVIKMCKHNIIGTAVPSITLSRRRSTR